MWYPSTLANNPGVSFGQWPLLSTHTHAFAHAHQVELEELNELAPGAHLGLLDGPPRHMNHFFYDVDGTLSGTLTGGIS